MSKLCCLQYICFLPLPKLFYVTSTVVTFCDSKFVTAVNENQGQRGIQNSEHIWKILDIMHTVIPPV